MGEIYEFPPREGKVLAAGGGPPDKGAMEARLTAVEQRLDRVEIKIDGLDGRLRSVEIKLGEIGGKLDLLVGKIPSWWQQPVGTAGMLAVIMAAIGLLAHFKVLALGP